MNNFKKVAKLTHKMQNQMNLAFENLDKNLNKQGKNILKLSKEKESKESKLAVLKRMLSLNESALDEILKKNYKQEKIYKIKSKIYKEVASFHMKKHKMLIKEIKKQKLLDDFYTSLLENTHKIGLIINKIAYKWNKKLHKNHSFLENKFKNLDESLEFLKENKFYNTYADGKICERSYSILDIKDENISFIPYSIAFKKEMKEFEQAFDNLLTKLKIRAKNKEHKDYISYLTKLKKAFLQKDDKKLVSSWQNAELAWLKLKSPLQIAHPLEYYEDIYTKSVAFEFDVRINDEYDINSKDYSNYYENSLLKIFSKLNFKDEKLLKTCVANINKTSLYICTPMLYYGCELNGLFSAQVVPNDEMVSKKLGKKIFAFVNFVHENSKKAPFMQISSEVFDKDFLDFSRKILFQDKEKWKKVYEILTIGHEFGHIFFIDEDSELKMNESAVFKNIEEFKATSSALMCFFLDEKQDLKLAVLNDFIKRAVSLIAYQEIEDIKPYYTEALISLHILFKAKVLSFDTKLHIDFSLAAYENFKAQFIKVYEKLAKHYINKKDAKDFLYEFCTLENKIFLPKDKECRNFVLYYYDLHKKLANKIDESVSAKDYLSS